MDILASKLGTCNWSLAVLLSLKWTMVISDIKDLKSVFLFKNVYFCACPRKNVVWLDASGKKACCHAANAFLSRLELIWLISRLNIFKMSKNCIFCQKAPGVNRLNKLR